jgi:ribosomal protein L14
MSMLDVADNTGAKRHVCEGARRQRPALRLGRRFVIAVVKKALPARSKSTKW